MKRSSAALLFVLWAGSLLSLFYVVQKPGLLSAFAGLANTLWTLIVAGLLLFCAYGIGTRVIAQLGLRSLDEIDRLLLGSGIGLGGLGLLALGLSLAQIASPLLFFVLLVFLTVFFVFRKDVGKLSLDLTGFRTQWNLSFSQSSLFSKLAILLPWLFAFLLTLAPQFEAFDALLYHLAQPAQVLQTAGLRPFDVPQFWFPNLTENVYLWALALGSERAAQIMHFAWTTLAALLLWRWAVKVWGNEIGRKTLILVAAIPSLPMVAAWAYADLALAFYALAAIYSVTSFASTKSIGWLRMTGLLAGLAMAVKYTSFPVPLACGLLILFWGRKSFSQAVRHAAQFSLITLLVASPWYVRNALYMGNPFYPFAFGGRYWDAFRAEWYAGPGTGIGWNPLQILLLPLNVILGHRDQNFYDGRLGPLFLILAPFAVWLLLKSAREDSERGLSLQAIGLFSALTFAAWTVGVVSSIHLWQARLLLPGLIPFAIPAALGWDSLRTLDSSKFRASFFSNVVIAAVVALAIFDNGLFLLQRNPLAVAVGAQSRMGYIARVNPSYAALMQSMDELPAQAYVYSLFEPRSYGLPRRIQPDAINYNFAQDLDLYKTPQAILDHWKAQGYTHVLVYERGLDFLVNDPAGQFSAAAHQALQQTLEKLERVQQTPDQVYSIYRIP